MGITITGVGGQGPFCCPRLKPATQRDLCASHSKTGPASGSLHSKAAHSHLEPVPPGKISPETSVKYQAPDNYNDRSASVDKSLGRTPTGSRAVQFAGTPQKTHHWSSEQREGSSTSSPGLWGTTAALGDRGTTGRGDNGAVRT